MIKTVDEYNEEFSEEVKKKLNCLRKIIKQCAPEAYEKISWGVPTYNLNGFLVQYAAYKKHIGFYTSPATLKYFKEDLKDYKTNLKNTVQFPIDKDLPVELIKEMVLFKVKENIESL